MASPVRSADPARWMRRVLKYHRRALDRPDEETIHQLRVSLRRCRTIAGALRSIDADPVWRKMRRRAKTLFSALGPARDAQVLTGWLQRLSPKTDDLGRRVLDRLTERERAGLKASKKAIRKFDGERWKKLSRRVEKRFALLPHPRLVLAQLVLEQWTQASEQHLAALRDETPAAWHQTRIALKRFRYAWEAFAPGSLRPARKTLKQLQDELGDVHDLDVLRELVASVATGEDQKALEAWRTRIGRRREQRLSSYRRRTSRPEPLWPKLRRKLLEGRRLEAASIARLVAEAHLAGLEITADAALIERARDRLEQRLADQPGVDRQRARRLLAAAARLHRSQRDGDGGSDLRALHRPLGWSREDQEIVARAIEPTNREAARALAALDPTERRLARDLAAALKKARDGRG